MTRIEMEILRRLYELEPIYPYLDIKYSDNKFTLFVDIYDGDKHENLFAFDDMLDGEHRIDGLKVIDIYSRLKYIKEESKKNEDR